MEQAIKDRMAVAMEIPSDEQAILDHSGEHPYSCECGSCLRYWRLVGPNPGSDLASPYGAFTLGEIEDDSKDGQQCRTQRLLMHVEQNVQSECIRFKAKISGLVYSWLSARACWANGDHLLNYDDDFWPVDSKGQKMEGELGWCDDGNVLAAEEDPNDEQGSN